MAKDGGRNEDAFWIGRDDAAVVGLCDGAGHASQCAARVLQLFRAQVSSGALELASFPSWRSWLTATDASLSGGSQTTFVGIAVVGDRLVGAYAGDSRAFLVNEHGCRLLTTERTHRLGSGEAGPLPIHEPLQPHDVVLLLSDGAWGPLPVATLRDVVAAHTLKHLADLPPRLLELAARSGRPDDMTVVAMRVGR